MPLEENHVVLLIDRPRVEATRLFGSPVGECHVMSVGAAGSLRLGTVVGPPGKLGWVGRHALVDLIMSAQEGLGLRQADALGPGTFLCIDSVPPHPIRLDAGDARTTELLVVLAHQAVDGVRAGRSEDLRRFLSHVPVARTG